MTQTLYSLRTDGDQYRITKFVDGEVESSYLTSHTECECPAGHRHTCRHRQMLPEMLAHGLCNTHWFWDFDRHYACDFQGGAKSRYDALADADLAVGLAEEDTEFDFAPVVKLVDTPDSKSVDPVGSNPTGGTTTLASPEPAPQQQGGRSWRRL